MIFLGVENVPVLPVRRPQYVRKFSLFINLKLASFNWQPENMKLPHVLLFSFNSIISLASAAFRSKRSLAIENCPGLKSFNLTIQKKCSYDNLRDTLEDELHNYPLCNATANEVFFKLFDANATTSAAKVRDMCIAAYANSEEVFDFRQISKKGFQFDNEYYSGGTYFI
mmetsp:Transcript_37034/g.54397  ORF Transcript_37034/g.54397 Transcript_37034/m.54397 type:complete len:169 (-) Transcript_37034:1090-1596(-)